MSSITEKVDNVKVAPSLQTYYDKLFQDGFLIDLHISIWGMGAQLSKDDLGITKELPDIFRLGKKMLIAPKHLNKFKQQESKARRYLYKNSYPFHISDAHFIPKKKLVEALLQLDKYKTEFVAMVEEFLKNYPTYQDEVLKAYPDIADVIRPLYPESEKLKKKFGFQVTTYELAMPRELAAVNIQELINRDQAKDEVKAKLNEQLQEQYKQSMQQLEQFTENAAYALRSQIAEVCETLVDKIKRKEVISKTNIEAIREEIANFRSLNFLDDNVVEQEIAKLEKVIDGNQNFKTDAEVLEKLNGALTDVLKTASAVSDIASLRGNYFRALKV